ncbi:unnamed protein product [Heligmosomoides polygyrus]|uniref:Secreted protein n=1 Tax=Heligmosomoides polygyrus TaxID=6339 RepID=A0A183G3V9_HELPZ|nr:unnamed protein product [Heligmosomoides polygyrus]
MMCLVAALTVLSTLEGVVALSCYHCISQLPLEGIEEDARLALKALVFQRSVSSQLQPCFYPSPFFVPFSNRQFVC